MIPALMELTGSFGQKGHESKAPTIKLGTGMEAAEEGGWGRGEQVMRDSDTLRESREFSEPINNWAEAGGR